MTAYNTFKRNQDIVKLHNNGYSYDKIGGMYNLSRSRIKQICDRDKQRKQIIEKQIRKDPRDNEEFYSAIVEATKQLGVSDRMATRAYRRLFWAGILHNDIASFTDEDLLNIRQTGPATIAVIRKADEIYKERKKNEAN